MTAGGIAPSPLMCGRSACVVESTSTTASACCTSLPSRATRCRTGAATSAGHVHPTYTHSHTRIHIHAFTACWLMLIECVTGGRWIWMHSRRRRPTCTAATSGCHTTASAAARRLCAPTGSLPTPVCDDKLHSFSARKMLNRFARAYHYYYAGWSGCDRAAAKHTGQRVFSCTPCDCAFTRKNRLKRHMLQACHVSLMTVTHPRADARRGGAGPPHPSRRPARPSTRQPPLARCRPVPGRRLLAAARHSSGQLHGCMRDRLRSTSSGRLVIMLVLDACQDAATLQDSALAESSSL